jgi:hypothetical protein
MNGRVTAASVPHRDDLWDVLLDGNPTDLQVQHVFPGAYALNSTARDERGCPMGMVGAGASRARCCPPPRRAQMTGTSRTAGHKK